MPVEQIYFFLQKKFDFNFTKNCKSLIDKKKELKMKLENQKKLELIPEFTLELGKANMKLQSTKIYQLKSIAFY